MAFIPSPSPEAGAQLEAATLVAADHPLPYRAVQGCPADRRTAASAADDPPVYAMGIRSSQGYTHEEQQADDQRTGYQPFFSHRFPPPDSTTGRFVGFSTVQNDQLKG